MKLNSTVRLTSDGTVQRVDLTYDVQVGDEVQVYFNDVEILTGWTLQRNTKPQRVDFVEKIPAGTGVIIRRYSDMRELPHYFYYTGNAKGGAEFNSKNLDENFNKILRAAQDAMDSFELVGVNIMAGQEAKEAANLAITASEAAAVYSANSKSSAERAEDAADRATAIADFDGEHNTLVGRNKPNAHDASAISFKQEGAGAVERSVQKKLEESVSVADFMSPQDLEDIATGTESFSVREAVKKAVERINEVGGTLYFPPGHYKTPYLTHNKDSNWIEITRSGVKFLAAPGSVILENFLFFVHGEYGSPIKVGSEVISSGSTTVTTATSHGLVEGDVIQLLSGINAYTPDGGEWQLGSQNPTHLGLPSCRYSEIHKVSLVESNTSVSIFDSVIYPNYKDNISGQLHPIAGVTSAEVRKLDVVSNVSFVGITFKNTGSYAYRSIVIRCAEEILFEKCSFISGSHPGAHIRTTDVYGIKFLECESYKALVTFSASGWNTFLIGGGTQNTVFSGCKLVGEAQAIDFTPSTFASDIGYTGDKINSSFLTAQGFVVEGCQFIKCSDGFTTHPGTYDLTAVGNTFHGCSAGMRIRNKASLVASNSIYTFAEGITFSAFYEDTVVEGNTLVQLPAENPRFWSGISFVPMSSEIMNGNNLQNVTVANNTIRCTDISNGNTSGILIRHTGNGVPGNPSFDLFKDYIKARLSRYNIKNNNLIGCSLYVGRWINGVNAFNNSFMGGSGREFYVYFDDNSARHTVHGNFFLDELSKGVRLGEVTSPTYPYSTTHKLGEQTSLFTLTSEIRNAVGVVITGYGSPLRDNVSLVNGGTVKAVRAAGSAVLLLDAEPKDGVSTADVRIFTKSPTTANKTLVVNGRVSSENIYPREDNTYTVGLPTARWAQIYAAADVINTSDSREKQQQTKLSDKEREAAIKLKGIIKKFKWNDSVSKKGEGARWHFGVMAQEVAEVFGSVGLDAHEYGLFCYDEWEETPEIKEPILDDEGNKTGEFEVTQEYQPAGNRYGIRYDQLLAFIISAI